MTANGLGGGENYEEDMRQDPLSLYHRKNLQEKYEKPTNSGLHKLTYMNRAFYGSGCE